MLKPGYQIFIRPAGKNHLHNMVAASIVETSDDRLVLETKHIEINNCLKPHDQILIFYTPKFEFMRQHAQIDAIADTSNSHHSQLQIAVRILSKPVNAECRMHPRENTLRLGLTVGFDENKQAQLMDISKEGISVITSCEKNIGDKVRIYFNVNGKQYAGHMALQSMQALDETRMRYGLFCLAEKGNQSNLARGLKQFFLQVQRTKLQHTSNVA